MSRDSLHTLIDVPLPLEKSRLILLSHSFKAAAAKSDCGANHWFILSNQPESIRSCKRNSWATSAKQPQSYLVCSYCYKSTESLFEALFLSFEFVGIILLQYSIHLWMSTLCRLFNLHRNIKKKVFLWKKKKVIPRLKSLWTTGE